MFESIHRAIHDKIIPGAVVAVEKGSDRTIEVFGKKHPRINDELMRRDTQFDIASLTKVVAGLTIVFHLIERGRLQLDQPVAEVLPDWTEPRVTIRHLLQHTSGLKADHPAKYEGFNPEAIYKDLMQSPLQTTPGTERVYSDLGMILLYYVCSSVMDISYEDYFIHHVARPLGLKATTFLPNRLEPIAATEYDFVRGGYKHGIVHDEKAERMGGVSAHAGLFSTASDLLTFLSMIKNDGAKRFDAALVREAKAGLGFEVSGTTYRHTGFTGVHMWGDDSLDLRAVLLTNRVHFGRQVSIQSLRKQVDDAIKQKWASATSDSPTRNIDYE
nr:serine hydrolase domain-containing protein [Geomicrobium sediminis]